MEDIRFIAVGGTTVLLIALVRGAFGGGFGVIGIPLLSLAVDPVRAGALLAPLFCLIDLCSLPHYRPATWSKRDLAPLLPGLLGGMALGFFTVTHVDVRAIMILIGTVTLAFAVRWFLAGATVDAARQARSTPRAVLFGGLSGFTSFVAHSGGPPLAMYLLPLGLPKQVYAGTSSAFFAVGNLVKLTPWLVIGASLPGLGKQTLELALFVPLGVWLGQRLHNRLPERRLYQVCYALLVVVAGKLLIDGVIG
ncbi:UPF0721 transmembrane protein [Rhodospirillales bacterium TMPK1]|uniref:Probable membrane transporter protein n=1 Tax=Roseiterribacter gracilis TaxID=2812848 RepID=A0A8S8X8W7_9PROT|nr:UPF0721 transmembrane protein [Rhodospirillales bacterium TMPK1]